MLPIPTRIALIAFVTSMTILALGIATSSPVAASLGTAGIVALAWSLAATMPLGRRVRRQRLEFAWWLAHSEPGSGGGAVVPGVPFEVRCYIRHRGPSQLVLTRVTPVVPGDASVLEDKSDGLVLAPRARTEFRFRLSAPAAGRVVLHGLAVQLVGPLGLFAVPLYFPNPLAIKVLPRAAARHASAFRATGGQSVERSGRTLMRRRGGGTELYELRELQPGDPFKSIAWKASARAGKLMVKEVEQEVQETRWMILDVSGTMRGGTAGERKLDFAIEMAAREARRALDQGDLFGLITVDGRIVDYVPARDGAPQILKVYDALLAATELVDEDLTDADDEEVANIVGRYVRNQDGIDFGRSTPRRGDGGFDVGALVRHAQSSLGEDMPRTLPLAGSAAGATLRHFCRSRGIPLPYRPDPRDATKGPGLAAAMQRALGTGREPASLVIVTDFDGIGDPAPLEAAIKLARAHQHRIGFVVPDASAFAKDAKDDLERDLMRVYGLGETRRIRDAQKRYGRLGAPVVVHGRANGGGMASRRRARAA
jgi:uncharacterized protein (DUF58 family)